MITNCKYAFYRKVGEVFNTALDERFPKSYVKLTNYKLYMPKYPQLQATTHVATYSPPLQISRSSDARRSHVTGAGAFSASIPLPRSHRRRRSSLAVLSSCDARYKSPGARLLRLACGSAPASCRLLHTTFTSQHWPSQSPDIS